RGRPAIGHYGAQAGRGIFARERDSAQADFRLRPDGDRDHRSGRAPDRRGQLRGSRSHRSASRTGGWRAVPQVHLPSRRRPLPGHRPRREVNNSERVLLAARGEKRAIMKTVVPILIAGRRHLLESFVDITELKRAEEARQRASAYRTLIEASLDPL